LTVRFFLILLLLIAWHCLSAQVLYGARAFGMAGGPAAINGPGIHSANPGSEHIGMFLFSFRGLPGASGFNSSAVAGQWKFRSLGAEAGIQRTGDELASMDRLYAGISHRIQNSSAGFRVNLGQFRAEGHATLYNLSVAAGGITRLGKRTSAGIWLDRFSIGTREGSQLFRVRMEAGLVTEFSQNVIVSTSVLHQLNELPVIRSGLEYKLKPNTAIRVGTSIFPSAVFIGSGFRYWKVSMDMAGSWQRASGTEFQITAGYMPERKKK
jgi:hypothetical protein